MSEKLEWTEQQINHPGEYHPTGLLFGGEVQLWVLSADPGGFDPDGRCHVALKSKRGGKDHGRINNWQVWQGAEAAKEGAQKYVDEHWDEVAALAE